MPCPSSPNAFTNGIMLRKLLDFGRRATRPLAVAVVLIGLTSGTAPAQGIKNTAPVPAQPETVVATPQPEPEPSAAASGTETDHWALAVALLSLVGVAYLIVTRPKHRRRSSSSQGSSSAPAQSDVLSAGQFTEVHKMIAKALAEQNRPSAAAASSRLAQNQPRPAANRPPTRTASTALPPPEASVVLVSAPAEAAKTAPEAPSALVEVPAPAGPRRAYVSSAPVNGRFRRNALQGKPAHNSIYELTWDSAQPDQTTFRVNPDQASHPRHISSYADVLEPACEFNLPQGAVSCIVTEAPGLLRRVDGDDWEIVRKARIHFA